MVALDRVLLDGGRVGLAATACARIRDTFGEVVGSGFLVGPDVVATCAHVVAQACGTRADGPPPDGPVAVDLPVLAVGGRTFRARVDRWVPIDDEGRGDVALLRLEAAPAGAVMSPVRGDRRLWDQQYRIFGFPEGREDGVWTTGRLRSRQATGWVQLQGAPGDQPVGPGFSGAPVWAEETGAIVGMTVAADRDRDVTTAYLVPIADVLGRDPELLPCPYRGFEPFAEEHAELFHGRAAEVERLLAAVATAPLVVVAGPSGTGKSSLVAAGLVPRLRAAGTAVETLRPDPDPPGPAELAGAVLALTDPGSDPARRARDARRLGEQLASADGRAEAVTELAAALAGRPRTVLCVDQVEELVETAPDQARLLLEVVAELAAVPAADTLCTVVTLRAASLDQLLTGSLAAVAAPVLVGPMDRPRLREVITEPAARAPGLAFEDGLVERILDDVPADPAQLPLLESLLATLWRGRTGGTLTHAAYTAAGGVSGALAAHAERAVAAVVGENAEHDLQDLLGRLVGLDRDGEPLRRRLTYLDLPERARALVPALAAYRVVVVAGHGERSTVELAHTALMRQWPRLREHLDGDAAFLRWRSELDLARGRWEDGGRDDGALLRGRALATADTWDGRHDEVALADRDFLARSRVRHRRDRRRRGAGVAVLAVVALVATYLAVVVVRGRAQLDAQQQTAAAQLLGQAALARGKTDPVLATELALAAYRADPHEPTARTALATQFQVLGDAEGPPVLDTGGPPAKFSVAGTGRDAVVVAYTAPDPGRLEFTLVTDPVGLQPQRRDLPRDQGYDGVDVSADGRWALAYGPAAPLDLYDLHAPATAAPRRLADAGSGARRAFLSPGGTRLSWLTGDAPHVRWHVFDVAAARVVDERELAPDVADAAPLDDPGLVLEGRGAAVPVVLRDLRTGATVRTFPDAAVTLDRGVAVRCAEPAPTPGSPTMLHATDVVTGAERVLPIDTYGCSSYWVAGGEWALTRTDTSRGVQQWRAVSLVDGTAVAFTTPPVEPFDGDDHVSLRIQLLRTPTGVAALVATGSQVLRLRTEPLPARDEVNGARYAWWYLADDRSTLVALDRDGARTFARDTGRPVATAPLAIDGWGVGRELWLSDVDAAGNSRLTAYTLPGLTRRVGFSLAHGAGAPGEGGIGSTLTSGSDGTAVTVVGLDRGVLSAFDAATGRPLSGPLPVATTAEDAEWFGRNATVVGRQGHPGQVLIAMPDGHVTLWDVPAGRQLLDLPATITGFGKVVAQGDRLVVGTAQETLQVWDLRSGALSSTVPLAVERLAGFTADGRLVARTDEGSLDKRLVVYDLDRRRVDVSMPVGGYGTTHLTDTDIVVDGDATDVLPQVVPLDPDRWRDRLCRTVPDPPSPGLLPLLPAGAAPGSPC